MHSLEKKFVEIGFLDKQEIDELISFLRNERDFVFELNNKLVNDYKKLQTKLDSAERQIMMDTECINRITNHGLKLEIELEELKLKEQPNS